MLSINRIVAVIQFILIATVSVQERKGKLNHEAATSPYAKKLQRKPTTTASNGAQAGLKKLERKDTAKSLYSYEQHARQSVPKKGSKEGAKPLVKRHSKSNLSERNQAYYSPRTQRTGSFGRSNNVSGVKQTTSNTNKATKNPLLRHASTNSIQFKASKVGLVKSNSLDDGGATEIGETKTKTTEVIHPSDSDNSLSSDSAEPPNGSQTKSITRSDSRQESTAAGRSEDHISNTNTAINGGKGRKDSDTDSLKKGYSTVYSIKIPGREPVQFSKVLQSTDEDNIETERSDSEPEESEDIVSSSDEELISFKQRSMLRRGRKHKDKDDTVSRSSSKGSLSSRGSMTEGKLKGMC